MTAEEYMNWDYAENWREHLNKEEIIDKIKLCDDERRRNHFFVFIQFIE